VQIYPALHIVFVPIVYCLLAKSLGSAMLVCLCLVQTYGSQRVPDRAHRAVTCAWIYIYIYIHIYMYMYASCTVIIGMPIYYLVDANLNEHINMLLRWNDHVCVFWVFVRGAMNLLALSVINCYAFSFAGGGAARRSVGHKLRIQSLVPGNAHFGVLLT